MTPIGGRPTITGHIGSVHRDGDIYELWAKDEAFGEIEGEGNADRIVAAVNKEISMAGLSMERIKAIRDGCTGVTPGPWSAPIKYERDCYSPITAPDWHAFANVVTRMHNDNAPAPENPASIQGRKTAAHIARLDPQTVTALCDLALAGLAPAPTTGVDGGEPLAWRWQLEVNSHGPGRWYFAAAKPVFSPGDVPLVRNLEPLYTHPAPTPAGVTEAMVGRFMDSMFGEYTSPGNDQTWVSPDWMTTKGKVRAALTAALATHPVPTPVGVGVLIPQKLVDAVLRIKADLADFDGDRRGHLQALQDAEEAIVTAALSPSATAPARDALEEALRAAHSYIVNNPDALGYIDVLRRINDALVQP